MVKCCNRSHSKWQVKAKKCVIVTRFHETDSNKMLGGWANGDWEKINHRENVCVENRY